MDVTVPCTFVIMGSNTFLKEDPPSDIPGQDAINATLLPPFASFGPSDWLQELVKNAILDAILDKEQILTGQGFHLTPRWDLWLSARYCKRRFKRGGVPGGLKPKLISPFSPFSMASLNNHHICCTCLLLVPRSSA